MTKFEKIIDHPATYIGAVLMIGIIGSIINTKVKEKLSQILK